ncbi:gliding motility lipoprotein GldB [Pseudofulvibacter geojedonensis]|uniref:Gliding motility lipoprotein GldB n=1 Tax=Pseudofulvibacter geojedonensis TaxID=1123758 RepID=A0ABW3I0X9_9FLAO
MKHVFIILVSSLFFLSCKEEYSTPKEISEIEMDLTVKRFEKDFLNTPKENFDKLKTKYPYLSDLNWETDKKDTLVIEMLQESLKVFPDFKQEKKDLELLFKHIKFYFPNFTKPEVITLTSSVDYRNKVVLADTLLFVSVDTYLGEKHKYYDLIPNYIARKLSKEQLISDVSAVYAKGFLSQVRPRTFRDQMIYFGKILYLQDLFMPFDSENKRIGYTQSELDWAKANEGMIWSYFIENKMLFSTDKSLSNRFIAEAPFSKFYLEIDNQSPGMLGKYIGWQIVRSFMKKNDVSLRELCSISGEELFNKSKYKPAR